MRGAACLFILSKAAGRLLWHRRRMREKLVSFAPRVLLCAHAASLENIIIIRRDIFRESGFTRTNALAHACVFVSCSLVSAMMNGYFKA
jgi:hypothetical protein